MYVDRYIYTHTQILQQLFQSNEDLETDKEGNLVVFYSEREFIP